MDDAAWTSDYRAAVAAGVIAGLPLQDAACTVRGHVAVAATPVGSPAAGQAIARGARSNSPIAPRMHHLSGR
jgi:hypothetical protein